MGLPVHEDLNSHEDSKNLYRKFVNTLTPRQEEALIRRVNTVKTSYKKNRQKGKNQKPDIRSVFSSADVSIVVSHQIFEFFNQKFNCFLLYYFDKN